MTMLVGSEAAKRAAELMVKPSLSPEELQELLKLQEQLKRKTAIAIAKKED